MVFPLGSTSHVVAVNEEKDYAGIVNVAEAHAVELDESTFIRDILHYPDTTLLPTMTVKEAVTIFENSEAEALAVIQSFEKRRVIGLLAESYALRRYSEELELRRRDLIGD
jgi:chloride channel protein, CIC family